MTNDNWQYVEQAYDNIKKFDVNNASQDEWKAHSETVDKLWQEVNNMRSKISR